jgi:hypothetical protein
MIAKHTPGPWVAEESEIFAAAGDAVRIAETVPLADDPQDVPGFGRTELANARLIAAAPDLLERLQAIIDWADFALSRPNEFNSHGARNLDGPVFDAARELLATLTAADQSPGEEIEQ